MTKDKSSRSFEGMLNEEGVTAPPKPVLSEKKVERLRVSVDVPAGQPQPSSDTLLAGAAAAGWSDDPGQGRSILIPNHLGTPAYEVPNPMPFAPPIGWEATPPIEQLIRDRVQVEVARLRDAEQIDTLEEIEDFDVPDDLPNLETIYEFIAMEAETPAVPRDVKPSAEDRARADAEYLDLVEQQRLLRRRHKEAALRQQQEEHDALYGGDNPYSKAPTT